MGANRHHREPASAAKKARGVEMLALGVPAEEIARDLGVARKTIDNWRTTHGNEILAAADERMESVVATVASGAAEARRRLAEQAPAAADVLLGYINGEEPENAGGAGVRLRAAMTLLDRVGVPVSTKVEHAEATTEETLRKLRAALEAKR